MKLRALIDAWALTVVRAPAHLVAQRHDDAPIAIATATSEVMFAHRHSRASARAILEHLLREPRRHPSAVTGRQLHVLLGIGASDLLERDQLAAFLASYHDPGVDVWYEPVSVTAIRQALHEVLRPHAPAKRTRLLVSLAARTNEELLRWAPSSTNFAAPFLATHARHPDTRVRTAVAQNANVAPQLLADLVHDPDELVRTSAARNPNTRVTTLAALALSEDWTIREAVAENPNADASLLTLLAEDDHPYVREAVAEHPNTPSQVLARLTSDAIPLIHEVVATNPNTHPALLATFAHDDDIFVRTAAIGNPNIDPELLTELAADPLAAIREAVGGNPRTPRKTLSRLAFDGDANVRAAVGRNPITPATLLTRLARDEHALVRLCIAAHPRVSSDARARLARDANPRVRAALAENEHTDPGVLLDLASDVDADVRLAVAEHPHVTKVVHHVLRSDPDPRVRRAAGTAASFTDPHARVTRAIRGVDVERRVIVAASIDRLAEAVTAVRTGAQPAGHEVRDASTLPSLDDLVFPTATAAQARFTDAPLAVRVLRTGREQRRNGVAMRNCTLSDSYIAACQAGRMIVAAFDYDGRRYNIAWSHDGHTWRERDLQGVENTAPLPAVEAAVLELTKCLEGLLPYPPLAITRSAALAEMTIASGEPRGHTLARGLER